MIPLGDAQQRVLSAVAPLPEQVVACERAAGLVLSRDVVATENIPPFANTAVDGFAVRASDVANVPTTLRVIGTVAAGDGTEWCVQSGEALRIMTGAPMPDGADAVVMVEDCEQTTSDRVTINKSVSAGNSVRPIADDVRAGDTVFAAGTVLNAAGAGVLSSMNARDVWAHPRARVALLSTGDELVTDGSPL
ncbi:MAG: molybdopterin molybdotransferase MoeA, partial [Ilumatobacteraceae bacterium]